MSERVELIVTEKDNAARRIADILSDGTASVGGEEVDVYRWREDNGRRSRVCVGLSGHVVGVDFPPEYEDWRAVEPVELVDADLRKTPTREDIVRELRSLARAADRVTIATDYDREGELIGKEAYEIVREETDAPIDRVRFSSITDREVREAFANPDEIDFDLAAAGEARQEVDLMWGAALTRFLSLSARQLGDDFISVGRVQSPTLRLLVERERAIQEFEPEDYWELFADLAADGETFEAQYFYRDDGEQERVWDEAAAEAARETVAGADAAVVEQVRRRTRVDRPPAPFDTTAFISAAGSLGYGAERAMSVAEDLYTAGYVTYPRTDNTVYPDDLDPDELLADLTALPEMGEDAAALRQDDLEPTRGDTESTDHPPIHPTGELPDLDELSEAERELYELVVRRFLATVAEPAEWVDLRVVAAAADARLKANGRRLASPGYHRVYPYVSSSEAHLPDVNEGDRLAIADVRLAAKQTQPPRRYSQSRLVELMKERGIGTKCLTADTEVLVRDDGGDVTRRPVEEVFERGRVVLADGDTDVAVSEDGPTVLSLEESSRRHGERTATLVSERPLADDEEVVTIETGSGSISVTGDHPTYVERPDGFEVVPATAVEPGERLLTVRRPPSVVAGRHRDERRDDATVEDALPLEGSPDPARFVGTLFDDEGRVSADGRAFVLDADPELRAAVAEVLAEFGVDATVSEDGGELYVRGRRDLERFLDLVPIADEETFYRGLDALRRYDATETKARVMERLARDRAGPQELASELGLSVDRVREVLDELRDEGRLRRTDGARGGDGGRGDRYVAEGFEDSVYATLRGVPSSSVVETVDRRDYDGRVYDLTVGPDAPNFAVGGGVVVHNSTRHHTIEKLYDRGYADGDPPRPTRLAMAVVDAAQRYAEQIVSEEMTQQLERDMTAIAEGEATLEEVTEESREMLRSVFDDLADSREEIGELLQESLKEDAAIGECPECGERLLIRRSRSGSAFVGCEGYPDCEFTLPLPDDGEPEITDAVCEEHGLHEVRILAGRDTYTHGCPMCAKEDAGEGPVVGACPECGREHGGELQVKRLRNGSRLVGCTRYPDCEYSLPLPRRGDLSVTDERCEEHGLRKLVVNEDDPWELGCPICNYREYRARQAERGGDLDLQSVEGVGEETEAALAEADVTSVADLVAVDPTDLAERADIEETRARGLRRAAIAAVEGLDADGDDDDDDGGDETEAAPEPSSDADADAGAQA